MKKVDLKCCSIFLPAGNYSKKKENKTNKNVLNCFFVLKWQGLADEVGPK